MASLQWRSSTISWQAYKQPEWEPVVQRKAESPTSYISSGIQILPLTFQILYFPIFEAVTHSFVLAQQWKSKAKVKEVCFISNMKFTPTHIYMELNSTVISGAYS